MEPSFASLKRNPDAEVHGVSTLFSVDDAIKLNNMEPPTIEVCTAVLYDGKSELDVEVYMPKTALTPDDPEGCCSGWASCVCVCMRVRVRARACVSQCIEKQEGKEAE